jgi:16S rRNA (uracil1498-N3)-methyltransferase
VKWPRFFAPGLDPSASETLLSADESHHLVRVMRLGVGDEVAIFDGRGHEMLARVERAAPKGVTLAVIRPIPAPPAPGVPILLVQAVLKGDKMDAVVRDATMAGASAIVPIVTERSLVSVSALTRGHAVERWQRVAVSSAKQCGRAHLPAIAPPSSFDAWLNTPSEGNRLLFVEPSLEDSGGWHSCGSHLRHILTSFDEGASHSSASHPVACIVGPEGGWADGERERAVTAGCVATTLGSMTLRADAAGLIAVSLVRFLLEKP